MGETIQSRSDAPPRAQDILRVELTTYEQALPQLLADGAGGRWVVIQGSQVVGTWDSFDAAIQVGYDRFGETPFLVQQVLDQQPIAGQPWQKARCPS